MELPVIPETEFISEPLLFWVEGKRYAGYYHINGCFYNYDSSSKAFFAGCDKEAFKRHFGIVSPYPQVETWEYLNPI